MIELLVIIVSILSLMFFRKWKALIFLFALFIQSIGLNFQIDPFFENAYVMSYVSWNTFGAILEVLAYLTVIIFIKNEHKIN